MKSAGGESFCSVCTKTFPYYRMLKVSNALCVATLNFVGCTQISSRSNCANEWRLSLTVFPCLFVAFSVGVRSSTGHSA